LDKWKQLGNLAADQSDNDENRLKASGMLEQAPIQGTPAVDPMLLDYWARKAGYRGDPGVHPSVIGGAPGIQLNIQSDPTSVHPDSNSQLINEIIKNLNKDPKYQAPVKQSVPGGIRG